MDQFQIRSMQKKDIETVFQLIYELAVFEKLEHQFTGSAKQLEKHMFSENPILKGLVAEHASEKKIIGYALYFYNYSTFLTKPGIYLEDLYVTPNFRNLGIGKKFLVELGKIAIAENLGRVEWSVLDWNENAISFYKKMGADVLPDWRICRVTGNKIDQLANS